MRLSHLTALAVLASPIASPAQESRFELGQRLRLFERELDRHTSAEVRKRSLDPLLRATPTFFSGRHGDAAGLLDRARLLLASETPSEEAAWAASLVVRPGKRLLDVKAEALPVKVESFYKVSAGRPEKVRIRLTLLRRQGSDEVRVAGDSADLSSLPASISLSLKMIPEGDCQLRTELLVGGVTRATGEQTVSVAEDLARRLGKLKSTQEGKGDKPTSHEAATLARLVSLLSDLEAGRTLETNYPAARLLAEAEELAGGTPYYGPGRPGQFWLSLVSGAATDHVRVQVPEEAKAGKPLPLVVAMHGAGGSENMFFDGYGDGLAGRLCAQRGWMLVATRSPLLSFGGGPDVVRVIDALAKVYPVDTRRVFLVGHSMGAAQAVAAAGRNPDRFAAVAALGGGGGFKATEGVKSVAFLVGCGERDFALNGARGLHAALVKAGVKEAVFRGYPDVEHLTVVQRALPEVFRFFERAGRR